MNGPTIVFETVRTAAQPISGRDVELLVGSRLAVITVGVYLADLVSEGKLFKQPNPMGRGKLYCDLPFLVDMHDRRVTNPKATGEAKAPEPAETKPELIKRLATEFQGRMEAAQTAGAAPANGLPRLAPVASTDKPSPERKPADPGLRSYEFPLPTRESVLFYLPADLTSDEIVTLATMLDAYGQLKRRIA